MILHAVYLRLTEGHDAAELAAIMTGLGQLVAAFEHGPNRDYEGKSAQYPYGFLCRFETRGDLAAYADDPAHKALGARLCALCVGGAEGIVVYDLEVAE